MNISRTRFVILFVISAFVFQFISNSVLGPELRGAPVNGNWFPGMDSPIVWKRTAAHIIYPIKLVMVGPLSLVFNDPDPAPPILGFFAALYLTTLALIIHFILSKIIPRKKSA